MAPSNKKSGKAKPKKPTASSSNMPQPTPAIAPLPTINLQPSLPDTTTVPPMHSSSNLIDFETFLELADVDDIIRFCDGVASTQEGRNLKLFWDRAFKEGRDKGRIEEHIRGDEDRKEMYFKGKAKGIEEAEEAANRAQIDFYCHGMEKGRAEERSEWTSLGHGPHCLALTTNLSDKSIQNETESQPLAIQTPSPTSHTPAHIDFAIQTESIIAVDFESPMSTDNIDNLCSRATTASSDTALGAIWSRAFKKGQDEGSRIVDGLQLSDVLKTGFEKGQIHGIIQEREQWEAAGHTKSCVISSSSIPTQTNVAAEVQTVQTLTTDTSVQTSADFDPLNNSESIDLLCALSSVAPSSTPLGLVWQRAYEAGTQYKPRNNHHADTSMQTITTSHTDVLIQTTTPPLPLNQYEDIHPSSTRLDWAEDAESLPILLSSPPPSYQPRNLSILRSSSPNPFSSLQQRVKRSNNHRPHQSRRRRNAFHADFPHPPRRKPVDSALELAQEKTPHLNWESDPRLSNLSQALKALGWILPS